MAYQSPPLTAEQGALSGSTFTPSTAIDGFRRFSAVLSAADTCDLTIRDAAGAQAFFPGSTWSGTSFALGAATFGSATLANGGATAWAVGSTASGRALETASDAAAQRAALGLGTAAVAATGEFDPAGTAASAVSAHVSAADPHPGYALESSLGGAALLSVGTTAGTVAAGDDARLSDARTPAAHSQAETTITFTDVQTGDASTTAHGFAPKAVAPGAGALNVLGIANGETAPTNKTIFAGCQQIAVVDELPGSPVDTTLYLIY